jgi:Domain of Unknown Function (DUF1080)
MPAWIVPRRGLIRAVATALGASLVRPRARRAAAAEIKVADDVPEIRFDFGTGGIAGWTSVSGQWAVEDMADAPGGTKALVQRATQNEFNVIVAPTDPFTDVDVSMKFKPIAGREDASGGIVFRFVDRKDSLGGTYYVVRANALEDNFRLYTYDRGRREIASARVKAPSLGQWHTVRVVAVGDHMQAWLDGRMLLEHRDSRFKLGRVGLWTKADSITAFGAVVVRGVKFGS